jgi:lipoprotein-anchoring transpeptidase ErfK/SrfK
VVLKTAANTGVSGKPTANGVFPIYERFVSTTMTGTNADGSHYDDPGVPWVNYFNGGDAVHGFNRASYGFPQSDGCVELPPSTAAVVYKMLEIGDLVEVTG